VFDWLREAMSARGRHLGIPSGSWHDALALQEVSWSLVHRHSWNGSTHNGHGDHGVVRMLGMVWSCALPRECAGCRAV
jgi:hypothetical protein